MVKSPKELTDGMLWKSLNLDNMTGKMILLISITLLSSKKPLLMLPLLKMLKVLIVFWTLEIVSQLITSHLLVKSLITPLLLDIYKLEELNLMISILMELEEVMTKSWLEEPLPTLDWSINWLKKLDLKLCISPLEKKWLFMMPLWNIKKTEINKSSSPDKSTEVDLVEIGPLKDLICKESI